MSSSSEDEAGPSGQRGDGGGHHARRPPPDGLRPDDLPCLFWDEMPDNLEEHPDYMAMQALAEESTPEERAENFKNQGNQRLQVGLKSKNRLLLRQAIECYGKGLALDCGSTKVNVALRNNRAHVNSLLGNWRKALEDAEAALALDGRSVKACFRGARAAARLSRWDDAARLAALGLDVEPSNADLLAVQGELVERRRAAEAEAARREAELAPVRRLMAALASRGVAIGAPQLRLPPGRADKPTLDEEGFVHWPVIFLYPESMQQDVIEDFHEADTLDEHLDIMFGASAPPLEWDADCAYTRATVEVYYLRGGGSALPPAQLQDALAGRWPDGGFDDAGPLLHGANAARWVRADAARALGELLAAPGHVVPGVPLFVVLASGTAYRRRFLDAAAAGAR